MKILKTKTYKKLLNNVECLEMLVSDYRERLKKAEDLKEILNKFSSMTINGIGYSNSGGNFELNLPDDVLRYVDDILGGRVVKQEGTKCLLIDKDGNVKTGLTKQKADKGFSYKLLREEQGF